MMRPILILGLTGWVIMSNPSSSFAVVGQAEQYDEFSQAALEDFQAGLMREDLSDQPDRIKAINDALQTQSSSKGEKEEAIDKDIEKLRLELLTLPKRDRFKFENSGRYKYLSNATRAPLRKEKGDSIFEARSGVAIDLSGKKTDFRMLIDGGKEWNIHYSENDSNVLNNTLNYRRKYYKKVDHSLQYKFTRHNSKTVEINSDKVRYDFGMNSSYNYPMTRKFSTNTTFGASKRLFTQEAFDQDSMWEGTFAPALFWNLTPKTRLSAGYAFGANRIRSKTGDANSHEIHFGYFGRVTRKSSASLDLSLKHQSPRSNETPKVNSITTGAGFIWQWTAKTQLTVQLLRSLQNSTSELVSGEVDGENATQKSDVYFTNNSLSLSINSRLNRRLEAKLGFNISHFQNKTNQSGSFSDVENLEDSETQQLTFPIDAMLTYNMTRFATLNLGYSFAYRMGDEEADFVRAHELNSNIRVVL